MYDDVKIELKKTKETVDRLQFVAAKGRIRTLQRIRKIQEDEELKELEKGLTQQAMKEATKPPVAQTVKKG